MKPLSRRGFSLLELLVVIAIIGLVSALTVPIVNNYLGSQRLSTTAAALAAEFGEAQQLAQTLNRGVEVRFYRYVDPESPGAIPTYRARQILVRETNGTAFAHRPAEPFDTGIIIASNPDFTTLLRNGETAPIATDRPLPRAGTAYQYFSVLFQPGGSLRLAKGPTDRWCLTLVEENHDQKADVLPANFVTLQLDPHNGSVRQLQP
jgi:uncharacterized protein (TIGR02596 family)